MGGSWKEKILGNLERLFNKMIFWWSHSPHMNYLHLLLKWKQVLMKSELKTELIKSFRDWDWLIVKTPLLGITSWKVYQEENVKELQSVMNSWPIPHSCSWTNLLVDWIVLRLIRLFRCWNKKQEEGWRWYAQYINLSLRHLKSLTGYC